MKELDDEKNKEREREWNRPHSKLHRSSSNLSLNKSERVRTISTPSRPGSATEYLSPTLHRHGSGHSFPGSRPSSPTGSVSSMDVAEEIEHEVEHQRERNWNSPRPEWGNPLFHRRSLSPLPRSRPGSPTDEPPHVHKTTPHSRTNSVTHGNSLSIPSPGARSKSPVGDRIPRPRSPIPRSTTPLSHGRPKSPAPPASRPETPGTAQASYRSRFGWSFPQHKMELPPLELDHETPQRPPPRPSSRSSLAASATTPSHIPIPSPRKGHNNATPSTSRTFDNTRSHRRTVTEFAESIGAIPPRIEVSTDDDFPPIPLVGDGSVPEEHHDDSLSYGELFFQISGMGIHDNVSQRAKRIQRLSLARPPRGLRHCSPHRPPLLPQRNRQLTC